MFTIKKNCKNPQWVVTVNCCGQPFYYFYKSLFKALIKYAYVYHKGKRYSNQSFRLDQFSVVIFNNKDLRNYVKAV